MVGRSLDNRWAVIGVPVVIVLALCAVLAGFAFAQDTAGPGESIVIDPDAQVVDLAGGAREVVVRPRLEQFSAMAAPSNDPQDADDERDPTIPEELPAGRWLLVELDNPRSTVQERLLVLHNPTLAGSTPLGAGLKAMGVSTAVRISDDVPAQALRPADVRDTVTAFELTIEPRETLIVALRLDDQVTPYSLSLWYPRAYQMLERSITGGKGLLVGGLLILALLVAGRWIMEGAEDDLAATVFVGTAILFLAAALGAHFDIVPARAPLSGGMRACALALFAAAGLYFLRHRLPLERLHPSLPMVVTGLAILGIGIGLASLPGIGAEIAAGPFAGLAAVVGAVLVLIMAQRGEHHAPSMLPGALFFVLCAAAAGALSFLTPGPYVAMQALALSGAVAAGTALATLAAVLGRPETSLSEADTGLDRLMTAEPRASLAAAPMASFDAGGLDANVPLPPAAPGDDRSMLALQHAQAGIWDLDVLTEYLYVAPALESMLGLDVGQLTGLHDGWRRRLHPDDADIYRTALESYIARGNASFDMEFRVLHEDGAYRWMQLKAAAIPGDMGRADRVIGLVTDVTARKSAETRPAQDVLHDGLTGIATRTLLIDRIATVLEDDHAADAGVPALIVVDVDRLKAVNEGLGHAAGDTLLIALARRLEGLVGPEDTVARISGDEFALFLRHGIGDEGGENAGRIVSDVVCAPVTLDGTEMSPSVTIGVIEAHDSTVGATGLLRDVEIALYQAKEVGPGSIAVFAEDMREASTGRLALETALKQGMERGEFDVLYQPIMSLRDGRLAGFEALVRWNHPERGVLSPDDFLPLAEETGVIEDLGRGVLEAAVAQLSAWQGRYPSDPPVFISVNVSSRQLLDPGFADQVRSILHPAGLRPGSLRIEVTESLIMANPELAAQTLRTLLEEGIDLSLDDFGTGFSSLSYLQRFPFGTLKIDRSFIAAMQNSPESETIVRAIATLAHDLGKAVVAEGPETEDDVRKLRAMGCEYAQGFIFGGALSREAAETLLARASGASAPKVE